uniref:Uncharacterized protein n=1 Tax=Anopheles atroparvus TaxID=41427 RepID=A0AAG5DR04_ANOAO
KHAWPHGLRRAKHERRQFDHREHGKTVKHRVQHRSVTKNRNVVAEFEQNSRQVSQERCRRMQSHAM